MYRERSEGTMPVAHTFDLSVEGKGWVKSILGGGASGRAKEAHNKAHENEDRASRMYRSAMERVAHISSGNDLMDIAIIRLQHEKDLLTKAHEKVASTNGALGKDRAQHADPTIETVEALKKLPVRDPGVR